MNHKLRTGVAVLAGVCAFSQSCLAATHEPNGPVNDSVPSKKPQVQVVPVAVATGNESLYVTNRSPLLQAPFVKLPIGSIRPEGWLRQMLEIEARGMTGHLKEISPWLKFDSNAWANKDGAGHSGWEELPYWLKGYGDLGYVLNDPEIIREARKWIEAVLSSQREDGWFGPRELLKSLEGKPDLWPHMVMLNVLQSYYEYSNDARILPFMTRYFRWQNQLPPEYFGAGYWPKLRAGDNIESIHWLYNRTGDPWLLELAQKIQTNMAPWIDDVVNWHNVNIAQGFRAPAMFYPQSKDLKFLNAAERNYQKVMDLYGQFPGGGFGGDENCRPGFIDPRQGFETCGIVEFMHSFEMLSRISGNPIWSDRAEEIAFNTFPASMTPDMKALHYLTGANMIQLDSKNKSPDIQNGGTMLSYSPFEVYRCCQHNVSHGWPYYAEELYLATSDGGLCASLYAPSQVKAKVASGIEVTLTEETDYPFDDTIKWTIATADKATFPLYLRVPRWTAHPTVKINGKTVRVQATPLSYIVLNRTWSNGDVLTLKLPMKVTTRTWAKNKNALSVDYGPLTFSLEIGERWERYGGTDAWPTFEVYPTTPWNYGLEQGQQSFEVIKKKGPLAAQPFTPENAPVAIRAKARKIPAWQQDKLGMVGLLQPSPARSSEPVETVTLIPMGAARLRITSFPVIGKGADAHEWVAPPVPKPALYKASASHVNETDTVDALEDGLPVTSSNDGTIPRFTWWDHKGTTEWVQFDLKAATKVSGVQVYWFDDTPGGGCRVPASWRALYKDGDQWKPVTAKEDYGVAKDQFNTVHFEPVAIGAIRLEVKLQPGQSGGILEWRLLE